MDYSDHNYFLIEQSFNISPLERRRKILDLIFLYKLLNGHTDCTQFLNLITLKVPARITRQNQLFVEKTYRLHLTGNNIINRLVHLSNSLNISVDHYIT